MSQNYTNGKVSTLISTDKHLILDGGTVAKHEGTTLLIRGEGWNLAIEEDAIASSAYGYLVRPTNEEIDKVEAKAKTKDKPFKLTAPKAKKDKGKKHKSRKPRGKTTPGRILEVKKLKALGESSKRITARTGLASSTISRICNGGLDHKLNKKQRAIILPARKKSTKSHGKRMALDNIKLVQIESFIRNNPECKGPDLQQKFDISSGTAWRVRNNQHTLQLSRNK